MIADTNDREIDNDEVTEVLVTAELQHHHHQVINQKKRS